jgi:Inhibitor of vertebrate lysozyme (Ivy)
MLPENFRHAAWLYRLDGVTLSIDEGMMIGGVPFIRVYGCKPHDCGGEQVSLVFSTDGKIGAVKVRSLELTGGEPVFFGSEDPALRRIVDRDF